MVSKGFGSDNHAAVHPEILKRLSEVNVGHAHSYGLDEWTKLAEAQFQKHFGSGAQVYFVFNGTGANVLGLRTLIKSYQACLCADVSHLNSDECAAPEFQAGKLIPLPTENGKISLSTLKAIALRRGDVHFAQIKAISLTQPTELGTVYTLPELRELTSLAKSEGIRVHMDGARIANAALQLGLSFAEFTSDLGVDVVSFGGTKNGFMFGEALVFLNPQLAEEFLYLRKQSLQLPSKTRYISAQFLAYLEGDLWKRMARHSNQMAQYLCQLASKISGVEVLRPVQSNAVFAKIPKRWVKTLRKDHFFYVWDETTFECRWMCSWDTTKEEVDAFCESLTRLSQR